MGLLTPLAVRIGALEWMPRLLPQITAIDKTLHRTTGGRITILTIAGPREPVWIANPEAAGAGKLRYRGADRRFTARLLIGEERVKAWTEMIETWPNFNLYERRTSREIKVFELTPTAPDAST